MSLAKFRPTVLAVKTASAAALSAPAILAILAHFQHKLPREHIVYASFPRDAQTDWFKGFGFLHFQPGAMSDAARQAAFDYPRKLQPPPAPGGARSRLEADALGRFGALRHCPLQEIPTPDTPQLTLASFLGRIPHQPPPSSIRCVVELAQSNHLNASGIQARAMRGPGHHRPTLSPEQFETFRKAFQAFGGFMR
ncbi:hypothetical protein PTTG_02492 [Puccinia triticina 1-1 BBBD Race 1]|uniref:Uncharacterized protein n=2 Tax=Puccinia triticina TaxID=208348 RepID=A0A180GC99_PUCT1|nr:uncharacterized protein PtA15_4A366 [Puccinia triticina]OAV90159.1 hypothetical protein PTTG_02492 [Puccinia triticina 1-1 BBBD Race 1]WAQ83916.1 hypothetical protein PtA15_4A366 [Puccinia triticina]WAR54762.1 hypothetical protein PtB15_4B380 [Puccinia triticina]